jgi:cyclase
MLPRIIPTLLLDGGGFYKTTRFKTPIYLGDPLNILRIFNDKEVDEIAILDISATGQVREPNFTLLRDMASECFMPLAYGGGVRTVSQIQTLLRIGFEKVILNSSLFEDSKLIKDASREFGNQSIVVCIDVKKSFLGRYRVVSHSAAREHGYAPEKWAESVAAMGAGEIVINSVDRDGTMTGYDLELIRRVTEAVDVPVIASGGARNISDFTAAVRTAGASACAAGAMFVFHGPHRAVLINVPSSRDIEQAFK